LFLAAEERKDNISASNARLAVAEVAAFQQFPADFRLTRLGSVEAGGTYYQIFSTWLKETGQWRTLVFSNGGAYLGYYETRNEPVELEKSGIVFPGPGYGVESGDNEEGVFDSGDAYVISFTELGPPDKVELGIEKKTFVFVSSPKRVRPDAPGYRFVTVAERMVNAMRRGCRTSIPPSFQSRSSAACLG
jgi:hypothetical protein